MKGYKKGGGALTKSLISEDERGVELHDKEEGRPSGGRKRANSSMGLVRRHSDVYELDDEGAREDGPKKDGDDDFVFNFVGLTTKQAEDLMKVYGKNELPEKHIPKWYIFCEQLWQPMPLMIWVAAIVEAGIQNWLDMGILLLIQLVNASIGFYEITKAGDAIAALKKSLKPVATVRRDGTWAQINATLLVPGDMVLLGSGSAIPADCRVNEGEIDVDQAALTGESLPVSMFRGDSCKMGSTVSRGEVNATVEFTGANTFFGKTAALLQNTSEYSNLQMILVNIMLVLVAASMVLCWIVFFYILSSEGAIEALSFTVVLLVASIPLAMEVVTTTTLALGSKELSSHGAIVARLAAIEDMAGMSILCSDKTGTLTMNLMQIQEQTPIYKKGESQYTLLRYGAMAAKWHEPPRDALDTLTLNAADLKSLDAVTQLAYMPFDPIVKRTEGTVRENGVEYKTTKGAPHVLLKLVKEQGILDKAEVERVATLCEQDVHELGGRGIRSLAVAKTNPEKNDAWELLGLLTFLDPPRPDTKQTIADAKAYGVMVKMITGDHLLIARETSKQLDLGLNIYNAENLPLLDAETKKKPENLKRDYGDQCLAADGFAQVFPEHKYLVVECLRELGYKTGMTGDGVNDAPALKRADVGIAVHGATDAARAAADIILTQPGLSTIIVGLKISRGIFARIKNFITYRVSATLQLLVFFFMATFLFKPSHYQPNPLPSGQQDWPSFFHMPVLMLMLITVLNDGTLISIGYDNVVASKTPEKWNLKVLFMLGSVLAGVALCSSLLLLWCLLDSNNDGSVFQGMGIPGLDYGQVTTSIYLKVSISDFLTLFSARTGPDPFWSTAPAKILMGAACLSLSLSTTLACAWPATYPDHIYTVGLAREQPYALALYIWIYCLVWWLIQDAAKVGCYKLMHYYNMFGIKDTGVVEFPPSTLKYIRDHPPTVSKPGAHH